MKDFLNALCILAIVIGCAYAALLVLRKCTARTYLTVEED